MRSLFPTIVFLLVCLHLSASMPPQPTTTSRSTPLKNCGYKSCHPVKDGFINVHIVPHTHDDVGWLKTVDQYYYGSKNTVQNAGVQYILDSVVDALRKDKDRRFIYVETAFFWKWWIKQHDTVKSFVRRFVNNGQLEFISGGWSMNDEAVTNYQSIIDQITWGLRKLNDSFGECGRPKMGWQIDPFGHSREMASIFAQLGFDGVLLGRIDYEDKLFRMKTKSAEMVWRGSQNLGSKSDIFTGVMYNTYAPPRGFCFDILCGDEPIIDDKKSPDYNVDNRVDDFFEHLKNMTQGYTTNNVIVTMGEDFNYQDADVWYKNLDKLIYYSNLRQQNGSKYNLIYSTPSCYVKAVYDETRGRQSWLVKQDDFFPYASDPHSFWTGYFTSRPTIKRFEREGNNYLQICKQLYALTDLGPEDRVDLNALREAMGVMQHHDAITGTEKENVAHDYVRILSRGIDECEYITATALSNIVAPSTIQQERDEPPPTIPFTSCRLLNVSQCEFTESRESFVVTVYNPLSRPVSKYVRIPVLGTAYSVRDSEGNKLITQLLPIAETILNIPGRNSSATVELIFLASDIPPLGFNSYYVEKTEGDIVVKAEELDKYKLGDAEFIVDPNTGLISKVLMNDKEIDLSQEFLYYKGYVGNNKIFANRSSGAYIFRPNGTVYRVTDKAKCTIYRGLLVAELRQVFNEWISQIIRVYANETYIEFDWLIGPIPKNEYNGKEIITRYKTTLNSNSIFYTDSNGRELLKRIRNFRPTWKLTLDEPVSGNYYPVTSKILIRDNDTEVAILTDRAQGGTSLKDGQIELMIHRNCLHDDAFGVGEALIEEAFNKSLVVRGSHYLVVGSTSTANPGGRTVSAQERELAQRKLLSAWTFLSPNNGLKFEDYKKKYTMTYSGLKRALPENVQILTLEPWKGFSFLLRLEHILESNEDPQLSQTVTVDLKNLFSPFEITSLRETTLGANQWLSDNRRLIFETGENVEELLNENFDSLDKVEQEARIKWNADLLDNTNYVKREVVIDLPDITDSFEIALSPMQIRTFIIEIKKNS